MTAMFVYFWAQRLNNSQCFNGAEFDGFDSSHSWSQRGFRGGNQNVCIGPHDILTLP